MMDLNGSMAHLDIGAKGVNGPVIMPLAKTNDSVWPVPLGAKLKADQLKAYLAGGLYVNVYTDANKGGEIATGKRLRNTTLSGHSAPQPILNLTTAIKNQRRRQLCRLRRE